MSAPVKSSVVARKIQLNAGFSSKSTPSGILKSYGAKRQRGGLVVRRRSQELLDDGNVRFCFCSPNPVLWWKRRRYSVGAKPVDARSTRVKWPWLLKPSAVAMRVALWSEYLSMFLAVATRSRRTYSVTERPRSA